MVAISRRAYAELYGPTKGDLVRLGDTSLLAEIEHDYTVPGHELVVGAGKTLRDSEGINARARYSDRALDFVIQNATIIDAELGIVKGDIGIRDGRIVGVGKAGNPDVMPGVHPDLLVGHTTTGISGAALHRHCGRDRVPRAYPVAGAVRACACRRHHDPDRRQPRAGVRSGQRQSPRPLHGSCRAPSIRP